MAEKRKILEVKNLKKYFPLKKGKYKEGDPCVKAVDDITFDLYEGETLGVSKEQKLPIIRSKGVSVEGMTLKIEY